MASSSISPQATCAGRVGGAEVTGAQTCGRTSIFCAGTGRWAVRTVRTATGAAQPLANEARSPTHDCYLVVRGMGGFTGVGRGVSIHGHAHGARHAHSAACPCSTQPAPPRPPRTHVVGISARAPARAKNKRQRESRMAGTELRDVRGGCVEQGTMKIDRGAKIKIQEASRPPI